MVKITPSLPHPGALGYAHGLADAKRYTWNLSVERAKQFGIQPETEAWTAYVRGYEQGHARPPVTP